MTGTPQKYPSTDKHRLVGSYHAGNPVKDSELLGCGLAIAYKSNAKDVKPEDFTIFSVNTKCVKTLKTNFDIPAKMPACSGGKCICAWFWQGQTSADEIVKYLSCGALFGI